MRYVVIIRSVILMLTDPPALDESRFGKDPARREGDAKYARSVALVRQVNCCRALCLQLGPRFLR